MTQRFCTTHQVHYPVDGNCPICLTDYVHFLEGRVKSLETELEAMSPAAKGGVISRRECLRCDHKWTARIDRPARCPRCKSYLWDRKKDVDSSPQ